MSKDYYQILGIPEDASTEDVKRAYRELAKKYHPDRNKGDADAERRFKEVGEAYDVLKDPEKRKQYDTIRRYGGNWDPRAGGSGGARGGQGPGGFTWTRDFGGRGGFGAGGLGDLLGEMFGFGRSPGRNRAQPRSAAGEDLTLTVSVDFELAAKGGKIRVKVPAGGQCPMCKGSGGKPGTDWSDCPQCNGSGRLTSGQGGFGISRTCPRCLGRGVVPAEPCPKCNGTGRAPSDTAVAVKIPAGISEDQKIRLPGRGRPGRNGGPAGDLYIKVRVKPHPRFERRGVDVYTTEEIPLTTAVLGGEVCTATLHGEVCAKVPAGTQPGAKLRLKNKGIHNERSGRRGDHYVRLKVRLPRKLNAEQRKLFGKLAETL
jgi:molecular chaperone DnaJ